jgi:hypothetical protein
MSNAINDEEFTLLVHKFRDEPASILAFTPCIEKLIDSEHCRQIGALMHQNGAKWERRKATNSLHKSLPSIRGVYMFVWRPCLTLRFDPHDEMQVVTFVLYVGKAGVEGGVSDTIQSRYQGEYSKYIARDASSLWEEKVPETREERLEKYLTLRPLEYWFLPVERVRDIVQMEKQLIKMLRPPLNTQHGVRLRPGKSEPAF